MAWAPATTSRGASWTHTGMPRLRKRQRTRSRRGTRTTGTIVPAWATWKAPPRSTTRPARACTRPAIRRRRRSADGGFNLSIPAGATGGEIVVIGRDRPVDRPAQLTGPHGPARRHADQPVHDAARRRHADRPQPDRVVRDHADRPGAGPARRRSTSPRRTTLDGALGGSALRRRHLRRGCEDRRDGEPGASACSAGCRCRLRAQSLGNDFFSSLASAIDQSGGTTVVTSRHASEDQALLQATATAAGLTSAPDATWPGRPPVMAAVAQAIDALTVAGTSAYMASVVQIQTLAEKTIAPALGPGRGRDRRASTPWPANYTETQCGNPGRHPGDRHDWPSRRSRSRASPRASAPASPRHSSSRSR